MIFIWKFSDLVKKTEAATPYLKSTDPKAQADGLAAISTVFDHLGSVEKEIDNLWRSYEQNSTNYGYGKASEIYNEAFKNFKERFFTLGNTLAYALRLLRSGMISKEESQYAADLEQTLVSMFRILKRMGEMPSGEDLSKIIVLRNELKALLEFREKMVLGGEYASKAAKTCIAQLQAEGPKGFHLAAA